MENIIKSGTIIKDYKGNDYKLKYDIDINQRQKLLDFIGTKPLEKVIIHGTWHDRSKMHRHLNEYNCLEALMEDSISCNYDTLYIKIRGKELDISNLDFIEEV
jgi:hypothetical protein